MDTASYSLTGRRRRRRRRTHSPMSTMRNATAPTVAPAAMAATLEWCAPSGLLPGSEAEVVLEEDELEEKYCVTMARSKSK